MSASSSPNPISALRAFNEKDSQLINAVVETPKGSRNKFDFDEERGLFYLGGMMPAGATFPFDFGFVPETLGEDGDPLDIVVLTDEGSTAFTGCLVTVRLLGAIEAKQGRQGEKMERNDRLIGAASRSRGYREVHSLEDVPGEIVKDIEHFFWSYNQAKGVEFKALNHCGPEQARGLVEEGIRRRKKA